MTRDHTKNRAAGAAEERPQGPGATAAAGTKDSAAESAAKPDVEATADRAVKQDLNDVLREVEVFRDRMLRLQADFDNFRKRAAREKAEMRLRVLEELVRELVPVLDHIEIGLKETEARKADPAVLDGWRLVAEQLQAVLRKFGVVPVDAVGQAFDPRRHEAVAHVPSDVHPAETVIEQTRRGFLLGERLIRPASVVVSSGPAPKVAKTEVDRG